MHDEYISREEAIEEIDKWLDTVGTALVGKGLSYYGELIGCIEDARAADVAPVVRCRDCKHAWIHPCGYVYCHRDGRNAYEMTFNLDSFCSYGERKDNG